MITKNNGCVTEKQNHLSFQSLLKDVLPLAFVGTNWICPILTVVINGSELMGREVRHSAQ